MCKTSTDTCARPDVRASHHKEYAGVLPSVRDPDPDPLVRGTDPDSGASFFSNMC